MDGILQEIEQRYSVHGFQPDPVDEAALNRILEAGRLAPSAKNRQAWRFVAIRDEGSRKRLESAAFGQEYVGQAPAVIALCTTNVDYRMPNGQHSYPVDIGIAGAFMMLQAVHEGLGTCPVTTFDEEEVKSLLTVPYLMRVVMLLLVGKPSDEAGLRRRLPASRIIAWDHW